MATSGTRCSQYRRAAWKIGRPAHVLKESGPGGWAVVEVQDYNGLQQWMMRFGFIIRPRSSDLLAGFCSPTRFACGTIELCKEAASMKRKCTLPSKVSTRILKEMLGCIVPISCNEFGNWVVKAVLESGPKEFQLQCARRLTLSFQTPSSASLIAGLLYSSLSPAIKDDLESFTKKLHSKPCQCWMLPPMNPCQMSFLCKTFTQRRTRAGDAASGTRSMVREI